MGNVNLTIFNAINGMVGHNQALDMLMKLAASDLVFVIAIPVALLWLWPGHHTRWAARQRLAFSIVIVTLAALGIALALGALYYEARPFVVIPSAHLLVQHVADNGFPSDHATIAFSVAGALFWWRRDSGFLLACLGALLSFARVYVGVHFPDQVLAGAAIGLLVGSTAILIAPAWIAPQRLASRVLPSWLVCDP